MNMTIRELFDRYGALIAMAVVVVLLVVLMPSNASDQTLTADDANGFGAEDAVTPGAASGTDDSFTGTGTGTGTDAGGTDGSGSLGGTTSGGSRAGGSGGSGGAQQAARPAAPPPDTECREDGAMPGFSHYSPDCVPVFTGDNGGATAQGVTADTIKVVYYFGASDPATQATLQAIGADDPRPQSKESALALTRYFNTHYETYKRAVELVFFESNADSDDDAALKADAVQIANEIKPLVVMGAGSVVATELAARGIICLCTVSESRGFYKQVSPHVFGTLPDAEEYFSHFAEYIGKRLAGKPAKWAGDLPPTLKTTERKFGLIYIEGVGSRINPRAKDAVAHYERELAKYGVKLSRKVAYTFDAARSQEQAANIIIQMKDAGVSNIACACDPLYPIFLTQAATRQQYFPEWFITGTALIDTTFFGRTYDQAQWSHAFGISPLYVFWENIEKSIGYREFHHGKPDAEPGDEGTQINVREAPFAILFAGIHSAGPNLTVRSFAEGLFRFGPKGGVPPAPLYDFSPESYTAYSDFTEVFWDPSGRGRDETGKEGVGVLLKVAGGKRFQLGQWPAADPNVFSTEGAVYTSDEGITFDHDADGHTHPPEQRCRSCT